MVTKVVMQSYSEMRAVEFSTTSVLPFPICNQSKKFAEDHFNIFKSVGGLYIFDYYETPYVFKRLSFWTTENDYNRWLQNPAIESYIREREIYHLQNQITCSLTKPITVSKYE